VYRGSRPRGFRPALPLTGGSDPGGVMSGRYVRQPVGSVCNLRYLENGKNGKSVGDNAISSSTSAHSLSRDTAFVIHTISKNIKGIRVLEYETTIAVKR